MLMKNFKISGPKLLASLAILGAPIIIVCQSVHRGVWTEVGGDLEGGRKQKYETV